MLPDPKRIGRLAVGPGAPQPQMFGALERTHQPPRRSVAWHLARVIGRMIRPDSPQAVEAAPATHELALAEARQQLVEQSRLYDEALTQHSLASRERRTPPPDARPLFFALQQASRAALRSLDPHLPVNPTVEQINLSTGLGAYNAARNVLYTAGPGESGLIAGRIQSLGRDNAQTIGLALVPDILSYIVHNSSLRPDVNHEMPEHHTYATTSNNILGLAPGDGKYAMQQLLNFGPDDPQLRTLVDSQLPSGYATPGTV